MPDWLTTALGSLITAVIVGPAAWLTARRDRRTADHQRIRDLEARVDKVERNNHILWSYNRALIDHIYRGEPPPPPPAPEVLFE